MIRLFNIKIDEKRIYGLDILRAIAILFVVFEHGGNFLPTKIKSFYRIFIFDGVSIFFVLSGFLIGKILINNFKKDNLTKTVLLNFWIRRWFRTLPNYFLILFILAILNFLFTSNFEFKNLNLYLIFSQNLFTKHPYFFPEAWSLSIEEWFYILIPICFYFLIRFIKLSPKKSILLISLSIIILVTFYRYYIFSNYQINNFGHWDLLLRKQVSTRLDSIIYGVIGAYFYIYHFNNIWKKYKIQFLFIGLFLFVITKLLGFLDLKPITGLYNCVFSFSTTAIATLMIIPFLSQKKNGKGFSYKFITTISLISYSIYLLHLSIIQFWIINKIDWCIFELNSTILMFIKYSLFWFLTMVFSILLYKYFEVPMMNLRNKSKI